MSQGEIAQIGKYQILGQIGEGAMGVVYRALDPVLNRPVAIKVMSDALARDTDLRGRFLREAQSAGSLQHPNVVTIYDFGEVDGHPFIAMEFVEGADLDEILRNRGQLSPVEKLDILIDVLNGLAYAHKRGIVHRDVKPANIRIDGEGRARIMDFGIAHLSSSNMTRTGMTVGTPAYMSPEQITGGAIGAPSDIFAVGAVMYELFAGVQAFGGDTLQTVMYRIVSAPAPELTPTSERAPPPRERLEGARRRRRARAGERPRRPIRERARHGRGAERHPRADRRGPGDVGHDVAARDRRQSDGDYGRVAGADRASALDGARDRHQASRRLPRPCPGRRSAVVARQAPRCRLDCRAAAGRRARLPRRLRLLLATSAPVAHAPTETSVPSGAPAPTYRPEVGRAGAVGEGTRTCPRAAGNRARRAAPCGRCGCHGGATR